MSQSSRMHRIAAEQELYRSQQGKVYKPDVYHIRKRAALVKRLQYQQQNDQEDDDEFSDLTQDFDLQDLSDALMAAELLIQKNTNSNLPMCFIHQLYSILPNDTVTDREIQASLHRNTWRKFFIMGCLEDEYFIMKTSNYCNVIQKAKTDFCSKHVEDDAALVFDKFGKIILDKEFNTISITKEALSNTFGLDDKDIAQLVSAGLLLPHNSQINVYWFSVPGQGTFITNLLNGRRAILAILKKRATKDIMETLLKQKKLHKCSFHIEFLLHDLVGSGRVERHMTTMGSLIKLTSKGEKGI